MAKNGFLSLAAEQPKIATRIPTTPNVMLPLPIPYPALREPIYKFIN